ncbi:DUF3106 domain-containing protein [Duganella sp. FT135W]|uniref:DUF3106 domain-containing protein n=1 Tax=Duganella flavida TaxID=2692175 RepID=A0A6L8KG91_9BURK|nr:DUF3106 domain-containing protein [Duganella flavida]MYM25258.1 DUF3106 domain-containing protein [Duganella flavida]
MAWSGRAKLGAGAAVIVVAAAGAAWVANRPDAPALAQAPLAAVQGKNTANAPEKILWKNLSPAQQQALEPLAGEWDQMEAVRKQKWLGIAKRYAKMNPDEQVRVQERMREWVRMTPEERRQVRQAYARAQKLNPTQKSTSWESYQQLPEEQKKELAAKPATKKQVANLPTPAQAKQQTVAPIKPAAPTASPGVATPVASPLAPAAPAPAAADPLPNASNVTPVPPAQPAPTDVK